MCPVATACPAAAIYRFCSWKSKHRSISRYAVKQSQHMTFCAICAASAGSATSLKKAGSGSPSSSAAASSNASLTVSRHITGKYLCLQNILKLTNAGSGSPSSSAATRARSLCAVYRFCSWKSNNRSISGYATRAISSCAMYRYYVEHLI